MWRDGGFISVVSACIFSMTDVWEVMDMQRSPSAVALGGITQ